MGQPIDLDFPAVTPGCARPVRERRRRRHIEADTPLVPQPVAMSLWEEASARLDVESPVAAVPSLMRLARARQRRPRIEADTPIVPRAVAAAVCEEASVWLEAELPRSWIVILAVRANEIYVHNPRFRRLLQRPGNAGRDWLWSFNRHWLSGLIWRYSRELHARLPVAYSVGQPLPPSLRC
jgi:hypothetical protein